MSTWVALFMEFKDVKSAECENAIFMCDTIIWEVWFANLNFDQDMTDIDLVVLISGEKAFSCIIFQRLIKTKDGSELLPPEATLVFFYTVLLKTVLRIQFMPSLKSVSKFRIWLSKHF